MLFYIPTDVYHLQQVDHKSGYLHNNYVKPGSNKVNFHNICCNVNHCVKISNDVIFPLSLKEKLILSLEEEVYNITETIKYNYKNDSYSGNIRRDQKRIYCRKSNDAEKVY